MVRTARKAQTDIPNQTHRETGPYFCEKLSMALWMPLTRIPLTSSIDPMENAAGPGVRFSCCIPSNAFCCSNPRELVWLTMCLTGHSPAGAEGVDGAVAVLS